MKTILRAIMLVTGSFALIAGVYVGIAGAVGGFGNHNLLVRLYLMAAGLLIAAAGVYCYYLGSNKSFSKLFDDIVTAVINIF